MTSAEIRKKFLDFFESKNHKIVDSAPVVPFDDPTLLFINAGMNQFKDVFLGTGSRTYKRAADTQKCIRVSGKHNDLEEVGYDNYHHTFFEMLGNWSFGDYYKEEAIVWAWEFLTDVIGLPKERLWATVYRTDDEALELWKSKTDINPAHVLRFDEKDNFWEMGDTGPCGPCSEIHINLSDNLENASLVNAGVPECIEIWNLVFIQYNRDKEGKLHDLPAKHVDTGMGFERLCRVIQKKDSNYDTDVFVPLIDEISKVSNVPYEKEEDQISMRVIADHIRTLSFAIADGAAPGNEGRGYVLRRILRRAARYGRKLELKEPFLYKLVNVLVETMGDVFPEIQEKKEYVQKVIKGEEESFNQTLDRGIDLFDEIIKKSDDKKIIGGSDAFKLYDTFGFPLDLTQVMAKEIGWTVDESGFNELMEKQRQQSREKGKFVGSEAVVNQLANLNLPDTIFIGDDYSKLEVESTLLYYSQDLVVLDKTPFYAESGGQVGDTGWLAFDGKKVPVINTVKEQNLIVHKINGELNISPGERVIAKVDDERRWDIMRNHSATHLLHKALREVLGTHVQQKGSYVGPDRLRFDFTHIEKVRPEELAEIEKIANNEIRKNISLQRHKDTPIEKAKEMGALMFFGDKYGDKVNVVQFGDYSMEFCGGTHVENTSQIGLVKITNESSISSGVRRIEAVTGKGVIKFMAENEISLNENIENIKNLIAEKERLSIQLAQFNSNSIEEGSPEEEFKTYIKSINHLTGFEKEGNFDWEKISLMLDNQEEELSKADSKTAELQEEKRKLEKELAGFQLQSKLGGIDDIISNPSEYNGINIFKGKVDAANMDELKSLGDELRNKMKSGVGVLISAFDEKVGIVCVVTDDLIKDKKIMAGKIVGGVAKIVGGGGGGKPHMATAGGRDISKIDEALESVERFV